MKNFAKGLILWVLLGALILLIYNFFFTTSGFYSTQNISYSDFLEKVEKGEVSEVVIEGKKG